MIYIGRMRPRHHPISLKECDSLRRRRDSELSHDWNA